MTPPLIVAAAAIPFAREALAPLGDVVLVPGASIDRARVRAARFLAIRTVTRADAALLEGSAVELVASATAGYDHVDVDALARLGIAWAHAPGCNAASVGEWVAAALVRIAARRGFGLAGRRIGIVGVGHTGTAAARCAAALGMEVSRCDPPRARREGPAGFLGLDDLIDACDAISLHVPLVRNGADATAHLLDAARLDRLAGKVLLNASRGEVLDAAALAPRAAALGGLALDVWPAEPAIDPALVSACDVATPHIAGYSLEGKARATAAVHASVARALGRAPCWSPELPEHDAPAIAIARLGRSVPEALAELVAATHPIAEIDAALRQSVPSNARGFEALRASVAQRRELSARRVVIDQGDGPLCQGAVLLGFGVTERA